MKRTLYLHVGHGKTGSSWLQSVFAKSAGNLAGAGITYPLDSTSQDAADGKTTSGNAAGWLRNPKAFSDRLSALGSTSQHSLLLSSEFLFDEIVDRYYGGQAEANATALQQVALDNGFQTLSILLFVRDPLAHACSLWQQYVKREGETRNFSEFLSAGACFYPRLVSRFMDQFESLASTRLQVLNYSRNSANLLAPVSDWLDVDGGLFAIPERQTINRSLTFSELELQRHINRACGKRATSLAAHLVDELPDVNTSRFSAPFAVQKNYWDSLAADISKVNSRLDVSQHYRFDCIDEQADPSVVEFNSAQLAAIAKFMMSVTENSMQSVRDHEREILRLTAVLGDHQQENRRLLGVLGDQQSEIRRVSQVASDYHLEIQRLLKVLGDYQLEVRRLTAATPAVASR